MVEVGRDVEPAGAQAERARLRGCGPEGSYFRQRALIAHNDEGFSRLNAAEEGEQIALNLFDADSAHRII